MIDLRNLGGGRKLIKQIVKNSKLASQPWNKKQQHKQVKTQKNSYTPNTRPTNLY